MVDILVCKIDATAESSFSVDHHDLAVVTIIVMGRQKRFDRGEHSCLDTKIAKQLRIVRWKFGEFAGSVIQYTHINSFCCFSGKHIKDTSPHITFLYDEILKENKLFCLFKFLQHDRKGIFTHGIIVHKRAVTDRICSAMVHITVQIIRTVQIV